MLQDNRPRCCAACDCSLHGREGGQGKASWPSSALHRSNAVPRQISVDRYILTGSSVAPGAVLSRDQAHLWLETQMLLKGASARISEVRSMLW